MTEEGVKNIKDALKIISEQCKATWTCENCPLVELCQSEVSYFQIPPRHWCTRISSIR